MSSNQRPNERSNEIHLDTDAVLRAAGYAYSLRKTISLLFSVC